MARLIHQCPSCHWIVAWPPFTPVLKSISPDTARLLATTGTLVPWVSQCPHCKGTFSRHTVLGGSNVQDIPASEDTEAGQENNPKAEKKTRPLCLHGQNTKEE